MHEHLRTHGRFLIVKIEISDLCGVNSTLAVSLLSTFRVISLSAEFRLTG